MVLVTVLTLLKESEQIPGITKYLHTFFYNFYLCMVSKIFFWADISRLLLSYYYMVINSNISYTDGKQSTDQNTCLLVPGFSSYNMCNFLYF